MMGAMETIVKKLIKSDEKGHKLFYKEVDTNRWKDYTSIIKKPMCFEQISNNLQQGVYAHHEQVAADIRLVYANCMEFNCNVPNIKSYAQRELATFESLYAKKLSVERKKVVKIDWENDERLEIKVTAIPYT